MILPLQYDSRAKITYRVSGKKTGIRAINWAFIRHLFGIRVIVKAQEAVFVYTAVPHGINVHKDKDTPTMITGHGLLKPLRLERSNGLSNLETICGTHLISSLLKD
jgi:hypothetical protein